jgi:SAM-dependent methyltransferase
MPDIKPAELTQIASRTLAFYEREALPFYEGTRDHDVSQNYAALLTALPQRPGLRILDFGCGPGRDLAAFRAMGHVPVGLDGCQAFVEMAQGTGCEVIHQNFFELSLGERQFDGVFANASLFHIPYAWLPRVLSELKRALVPGGVLFCSNPRAFQRFQEGWHGERYGCYLTIAGWTTVLSAAGFELSHHYLRPSSEPENERPWLAMVWRKAGA